MTVSADLISCMGIIRPRGVISGPSDSIDRGLRLLKFSRTPCISEASSEVYVEAFVLFRHDDASTLVAIYFFSLLTRIDLRNMRAGSVAADLNHVGRLSRGNCGLQFHSVMDTEVDQRWYYYSTDRY